jgi:atypical dual specificity phosphatase
MERRGIFFSGTSIQVGFMAEPSRFSWIEQPLLAALAHPESVEDLEWLRRQGIQVLLSLTEEPPPRRWVNDAGLLLVHIPVVDMEAPTPDQLEKAMAAIDRAKEKNMGVAVHCEAGLGRTGVIVACYLVTQGLTANQAIEKVRRLRPGSIETDEQAEAVKDFHQRFN